MTDDLPAKPSREPHTRTDRVTGRLKAALDAMVFGNADGIPLDYVAAGRTVNLSARSMRRALERPIVRQYLKTQKQVFREAASAANIQSLVRIRDAGRNETARVNAIKVLEDLGDQEHQRAASPVMSPGLSIVIQNVVPSSPAAPAPMLDVTPSVPVRQIDARPAPPAERGIPGSFVSVSEVEGRHDPSLVEPMPIEGDDEPEQRRDTRAELEALQAELSGERIHSRDEPRDLVGAPKIRGEVGFQEPEPRGSRSPMRRRWARIRSGD
jgi:hypothetical protein